MKARAVLPDSSAPKSTAPKSVAPDLPRETLLRLLVVMAIALAPHAIRLPLPASALIVLLLAWRAAATQRRWREPPRTVRVLLALAAFTGVVLGASRTGMQTAGVTLLAVMIALKLTELRTRRDLMVLTLLLYFLLVTHFLFSQEPWTAFYLPLCALLITAVLVDASHVNRRGGKALPLRDALRISTRLLLLALPLMAAMFVLFPRLPGPLWGLPDDAGAEHSGLSDSMAPGAISDLVQSDAIAFRVSFEGAPPPSRDLYWRGPVFDRFDGQRWDAGPEDPAAAAAQVRFEGGETRYEVTLEPQRSHWLFALDLPLASDLPADARLDGAFQLLTRDELRERRFYRLVSHTHYRLQPQLDDAHQQRFRQLPPRANPRTQALAAQWRAQGLDDAQIVDAALTMFRREKFFYTLHPPSLGRDPVDAFLFDTRKGFCEHYASSFTALMRAAGVPARVVTGYQGGELNDVGDYYIVRQSDAHAWSEVWLADRGWVRVDPTAAVAPERIERGIAAALGASGELPAYLDARRRDFGLRYLLAARLDWMDAQWNRWVLGYGPELQQDFLERFGLIGWRDLMLALTALVTLILAALGVALLRRAAPRLHEDAALAQWRKLQARLARAGLPQVPGEGPLDFSRRVADARPELGAAMARIAGLYLRLRYLEEPRPLDARNLARAIAQLKA